MTLVYHQNCTLTRAAIKLGTFLLHLNFVVLILLGIVLLSTEGKIK